ncbi:MAG: hypothetical protein AB8H47_31495 [Bacteroidia bacterium]
MRSIIFCLFIVAITSLSAQENASWRFHLQGYNFVFPGVELAYEYPFYTKTLGESGQKLQAVIAPVVDVYAYRGNHTGISLSGDLSLKYSTAKGFEYQIFGAYGILEAVLAGDVFEANGSGGFESSSLKGNLYPQWKAGVGFGKKLADKPISINLRIGVREARLPAAYIVPNASVGINWFFKAQQG